MLQAHHYKSAYLIAIASLALCFGSVQPLFAFTSAKQLTLIGTGDLQGQLEMNPQTIALTDSTTKTEIAGGISRIASLIQHIKQQTKTPVIVVSSGDDLMGKYFHQFNGEAIFSLMAEAGYEILGLGNHEFDKGATVLATALNRVNITALCSDLLVADTAMAKSCVPYILRDYQGIQVGFFSLMTENFPVVTISNNIKIQNDHITVARKMVHILQQQGAQVIIAVTHIGSNLDQHLAAEVTGIDIIFGGHSHDYHQNLLRIDDTLIMNGGEKGSALVKLEVALDKNNKMIPASATYALIPITTAIKPHPDVEAHLRKFKAQLPATTIIGRTEQEWDLSSLTLRSRESAVANIVTDLIRSQFNVDAVLYNGGSFRGNTTIPPGEITNGMIADIDAFESNIYLLHIQGKYIRQILEHSAALSGQGGFLQVSGLRFTLKENDTDTGQQSLKRVQDIRILSPDNTWLPLRQEHYYKIASNDFLVKHGGDHYFWFNKYGQNIQNTYSTMGALLSDAFRQQKTINPQKLDGRISIIGTKEIVEN